MSPASKFRSLLDCLHCEQRSMRQFCNLQDGALKDFDSLGTHSNLEAGARIFEEESASRSVFVVCNGRAKLSTVSKQGKTLILKIAGPGDVLGLGAVLADTSYEVTAETMEPTQVKRIPKDELLSFLRKHGEASLHAAQALSGEYREAFFDVRRLALSVSAASRLAGVLLDLARVSPCGTLDMRFTMTLTHEELASLIGSSRETVTRTLGQFKRDKLIQVRGATIVILAQKKLEDLAA